MIGHNGGPPLSGHGWRRHCWSRARAELLPRMPLEVVRRRVARAAELGLDYRTYAGLRASTGRDVVAFLFSTNGLGMERRAALAPEQARRLRTLRRCGRSVMTQPPLPPERVAAVLAAADIEVSQVTHAPPPAAPWSEIRARLAEATWPHPADGVVLVEGHRPRRRRRLLRRPPRLSRDRSGGYRSNSRRRDRHCKPLCETSQLDQRLLFIATCLAATQKAYPTPDDGLHPERRLSRHATGREPCAAVREGSSWQRGVGRPRAAWRTDVSGLSP